MREVNGERLGLYAGQAVEAPYRWTRTFVGLHLESMQLLNLDATPLRIVVTWNGRLQKQFIPRRIGEVESG